MPIQIIPVKSIEECCDELDKIHAEVHKSLDDGWDWLEAAFYVGVIRALANPLPDSTFESDEAAVKAIHAKVKEWPVAGGWMIASIDEHEEIDKKRILIPGVTLSDRFPSKGEAWSDARRKLYHEGTK